MGQILGRFHSKEWRKKQLRMITDRIFDHFTYEPGRAKLKFEDLYIAVLLVYNDINKHLPGPHFDPPSKDRLRATIQASDLNLDGAIDREEFVQFILKLTADTFLVLSHGLMLTLAVAPTVAVATKRATESVPTVGKLVQRLPKSIYASIFTLAVLLVRKSFQELE